MKKTVFVVILSALIIAAGLITWTTIQDIKNPDNTTINGNEIVFVPDEPNNTEDQYNDSKVHEDLKIDIESEDIRDIEIIENTNNTDNTDSTVAIVDDEVFAGNTDPSTACEQWKADTNEEAIANGYEGEIDTRTREEVLVDTSREIGLSDDQIKALWFYDGNKLGYVWPETREYSINETIPNNTENSDTDTITGNQNSETVQPEKNYNQLEKQPEDDITTTNPVNKGEENTTSTDTYNNYDNVWTPPANFIAPGTIMTDDNIVTGEGEVVEFEDDDNINWE